MASVNNHGSSPSQRMSVNQPSIVVRGRVLSGGELQDYAERNGLCPRCGVYQTHKKRGSLLKPRFEPMTMTNEYNEVTVYKGYCIAPTCYTLERAKKLLGEVPARRPSNSVAAATDAVLMSPGQNSANSRNTYQPPQGLPYSPSLASKYAHSSGYSNPTNGGTLGRPNSDDTLNTLHQQHRRMMVLDHTINEGSVGHHRRTHSSSHARQSSGGASEMGEGGGSGGGGSSHHRRTLTAGDGSSHNHNHSYSPLRHLARGSTQEYFLGSCDGGAAAAAAAAAATTAKHPPNSNFQESGGGSSSYSNSEALLGHDTKQRCAVSNIGATGASNFGLSLPPLMVGSDRAQSTITEHTEELSQCSDDPIVRALEEKIDESNYLEFFNLLDHRQRQALQVMEGFRLLRYYLVRDHLLKPEGVVLAGENWVKVMNEKITQFAQQPQMHPPSQEQQHKREVVVSGLVTLLTISRQGTIFPYKRSLVRKDTMEMTMKLFDACSDDDEIIDASCALVVSLSLHEKNSLNAKSFPRIAILVRKLAYVVLSDDHNCGKGFALRALFHISNQRKKAETTGKTALHDVRKALGNEPSIRAILKAMEPPSASAAFASAPSSSSGHQQIMNKPLCTPPMVEAGLALLWKICLPKDEDLSKVLGASVENLQAVVQILEQPEYSISVNVIEAACGLLTNLALDDHGMFPADLAHRATIRICELMTNPEHRTREVAIVAVHAFCNLLANPNTKPGVLSMGDGDAASAAVMNTILTLLKEFTEEEEVVEYSCLAGSHAAFHNPKIKRFMSEPEFFNRVRSAFETFVTSRGEHPSLPVKDATLCCFASISGCEEGGQALTDSRLMERLEVMHKIEADVDFKRVLEVILRNTTVFLEQGSGGRGGLLGQQPSLFLQLLRNAVSEEDIVSVIQELRSAGEDGLPALGNQGFDELLVTLTRYEYSPAVQTEGSNLLAEIYYQIPLDAVESPTQLPGGSWAILHRKQVVDLLCCAIGGHPCNAETQIASMRALENFLLPLYAADLSSPNVHQIQRWLAPVWDQTIRALTATPDNEQLHLSGLNLCWLLFFISSETELQNWVLSLLQQVFDTMSRFPSNDDLNLVACDILVQLKENQDCADFMGNSSCVEYMVRLLDTGDAEFALRATATLATLTTKVFIAVDQMIQVPNILLKLIVCMNSQQSQHHVVIQICVILEALLNFEDTNLRFSLVEHGGVAALCRALEVHESNATLCKHTCIVMSLLVPCLVANALETLKASLEITFLPLLQTHIANPESEAAILDLLRALGSTEDHDFKAVLQTEQNLQLIVQAMSCHLGSGNLQRSGCRMLWLLSGYGDGKRLIGKVGGIQAILNSMLAHNQSTSIQKEGLTALKNLATEAANKPLLAELDCVRVVTYALIIHYQHPLVVSGALSALNNIAIDCRTKSVASLPPEILNIVVSAMRRFPRDESVQSNACFYLKSCTYLEDNRILMHRHAMELFAVLQQASATFPQSCQERAQGIMKKVQII